MIKKLLFLVSLIICVFCLTSNASHMAGGSIKYTYVGPGSVSGTHQYQIRVGIYRYCAGANITGTTQAITARCSFSGATQTFNIPVYTYVSKPGERPANGGKKDISSLCTSRTSRCRSTVGAAGYEEIIFRGIITLSACNSWTISTRTVCCRNALQNFNATGAIDLKTTFSTGLYPVNSGPDHPDQIKPMLSVCLGQDVVYGIGAIDPDGDSLYYELTCPDNNGSPASGRSGFKCTSPITGLKLDKINGIITFKHSGTIGAYAVAFWVKEYERCTGRLKAQTRREIQFNISACTNKSPIDISGISNIVGAATKTGKHSLVACQGEKISWQDTIFDPNTSDSIRFNSNIATAMPGGTMTTRFLSSNKAVVKFEWTAKIGTGQHTELMLFYNDNKCDFPGYGFSLFKIKVDIGTHGGPDKKVCHGDSVLLTGFGGNRFTWKTLSGDQLVTGVNWFPTPQGKSGIFIPKNPTTIEVWSNLNYGCYTASPCKARDTIQITLVDSFSIFKTPNPILCNPASGQLNITPSRSTFSYSYKWDNSQYLNNDTIKNPLFSNVDRPTTFKYSVTSSAGCTRTGNIKVEVTEPFPTNMEIVSSDTIICRSKKINLSVNTGSIDYGGCQEKTINCQGNFKKFTLGSGSITNVTAINNSPMVYASSRLGQKNQYLYKASDIIAAGLKPGPIKSLAFNIKTLYNSAQTLHNKFTIKIGCSNLKDLPLNSFVSGLTEVFNPKTIRASQGWNEYVFDSEYNWDGKSNLVIEVCWENNNRLNQNHNQTFDSKNYRASNSFAQTVNFQGACSSVVTSLGILTNQLPQIRFNACVGFTPNRFNFSWMPTANGGFIGNTNMKNVSANVNLGTAKKYFVVVSDSATGGLCKDTLSIDIKVINKYNSKPYLLPKQCYLDGAIDLDAPTPWNVTTPGGRWSGAGITNNKLGHWDPLKSGIGKFWVTYSITGDACASTDSTLLEIAGLPDPSLLTPDTFCGIYGGGAVPDTVRHKLVPKVPGGWFTGVGVDSTLDGNGKMIYWVNGTLFKPSKGKPDFVELKYTVREGCLNDSMYKIPVVAGWDHSFLGVLSSGVPHSTINFCATSDRLDTLAVKGKNATWEYLDDPSAMLDSKLGVLDVKKASKGQDTIGRIKVGNYGFCGTDTIVQVQFIRPPEIDICPNTYCDNFVNDPKNFTRTDTVQFRIPKGPSLPGSTGKKTLDPKGFDPNTEIKVSYGSIASTGWASAIDQVAYQYNYNFWDGNPWAKFPHIARYRVYSLPKGKNRITYTLGIRYRNTHPDFACMISDTAYVEKVDSLRLSLRDTHRICKQESAYLDAGNYNTASYAWSNGKNSRGISVKQGGIYTVTVTTEFCKSSKQTIVINGCVGIDEKLQNGVRIRLFPNPASSVINLNVKGANNEITEVSVIDLLGAEVSNLIFNTNELSQGVEIDISSLNTGTYFFKIINGESYATYRIIVR